MAGSLSSFFLRRDLGQHRFDAELVDLAQARGRNAQPHPAVLALDPEAAVMQVGLVHAARLVVRVRDQVSFHRLLAGDVADSGHGYSRKSEKGRIVREKHPATVATAAPARR